jgi:hypothetical protein
VRFIKLLRDRAQTNGTSVVICRHAGRVGAGMPDKVLADLWRRLDSLASKLSPLNVPPTRSTRFGSPLVLSGALGRAEACRRSHIFDFDGRRPVALHGFHDGNIRIGGDLFASLLQSS